MEPEQIQPETKTEKKSSKTNPASWVTYKPQEIEQLVVKLAKSEKSPSQIGLALRDSYGIPDVKATTKKSILEILKDNKMSPKLPEDMRFLIQRYVTTTKHLEKNKKDGGAVRGIQLTIARINRLAKYYKAKKLLPAAWHFEPSKAKLLLE